MRRSRIALALLVLFLLVSIPTVAQTLAGLEQGIKPYGSYEGGEIDSISMLNGSITLNIPLLSYPQRGGKLHMGFRLEYMNPWLQPWAAGCNPYTHHCTTTGYNLDYGIDPSNCGYGNLNGRTCGSAMGVAGDFGYGLNAVLLPGCCPQNVQYYTVTDPDFAVHVMGPFAAGQYRSVDATGYLLNAPSSSANGTGTLWDQQGNKYYFSTGVLTGIEDPNGNQVTTNTTSQGAITGWTDTLGRVIPVPPPATSTTDLSHCPASATIAALWTPRGPNGGTSPYKFCWATINISFNAGGTNPTSTTATNMVGIVLPNLTGWTFAYDNFGELTTITLPTGGTISYTWTNIYGYCVAPQYVDPSSGYVSGLWPYRSAITSRTVNANDGTGPHTWNYVGNGGNGGQTVATDPLGNDTVHNETVLGGCSIYETELDRYSGSHTAGTLLQKTTTSYNYSAGGGTQYGFGNVVINVVPNNITTTDALSGKNVQVTKTFDSGVPDLNSAAGGNILYGELLTENHYDWAASGSLGNLLKQMNTQYMALSGPNSYYYVTNNLLSLPYMLQVQNGSGAQMSLTQYNYDECCLVSSGVATQHDSSPPNARGNLTSLHRWLNGSTTATTNCGISVNNGYLVSYSVYNDTGTVDHWVDSCGASASDTKHKTSYVYSSTYAGAYPTTVTNPLGQSTTNVPDLDTGLLISTTDPNHQPTSYTYDNMWRIASVTHSDDGVDTITHQETTPPFTATLTTQINSLISKIETNVFDGVGRVTQHQLSDPNQGGTIYTDTTYDALGRTASVSNPHRSTPDSTSGITTYFYDALGRTCLVVPPDGTLPSGSICPATQSPNTIFTTYSGNCTTVTDQASNSRRSCSDGLGRLIEVDEPGTTAPPAPIFASAIVGGSEQSVVVPTVGTGSVTFKDGPLQSKQVLTHTATPGTGSVTISGTEESHSVFVKVCNCLVTTYDSGTVSITVNGHPDSTGYAQGSGSSSIASGLASAINGDSAASVTASANGSTVTLTAKTTGSSTNYSLSASSASQNGFSPPSFTGTPSGSALTGGTNTVYTTIYDSGGSTITVNGYSDTVYWSGSSTTGSSIAAALALKINADPGAFVTASAVGDTVNLTSKATGAGSNYSLASSGTYDSTDFSSSSFPSSNSGSTLTVGSATLYDSGSVWVAINGTQYSANYGQNDTPTSVATSLANALNASSLVTATASSSAVTITANSGNAVTSYVWTTGSSTSKPSYFASPSFTVMVGVVAGTPPALSLSTPAMTTYNYDALDNLTGVVQSGARQRSFIYNSLSRLTSATNPESGTINYTYDANGNVSTKIAPAPNQPAAATTVTTTYTYDVLNRITGKSYSDGSTPSVSYFYDGSTPSCSVGISSYGAAIGRRTAMCDAGGSDSWGYTPVIGTGWKTTEARITKGLPPMTSVYQSNLDGSLYTLTYPSAHVVTYQYSRAARVLSATDSTSSINYASGAAYWPSGALAQLTNGSNLYSTYILNSRLQPCWIYVTTGTALPITTLCSATDSNPSNILDLKHDFKLGIADNGNVYGITNNRDTNRSLSFVYDALNRLSTAQTASTYSTGSSRCWSEEFGYDVWGNLLSRGLASPSYVGCSLEQPLGFTMTAQNQILNTTSTACFNSSGALQTTSTYCYDAGGNMMADTTGASHYYDAENHLKSLPTLAISYLYDGDGRRLVKLNSNGQATKLYWYGTGSDPLDETDGTGATNNTAFFEYAFFGGKRIARRDYQNNLNYYVADHLGTARTILQAGQSMPCYDADFYPFGGEHTYTDTCDSGYKFTGKERDSESGLDNFGARYNSSAMGRFMSPDPAGLLAVSLKNPQTWNWYTYTMNNPLRYTDPTGKYTCADDKNKCQTDQDKAFEAARQRDLQSNDKAVVSAAQAYGDPTKDNHVGVGFVEGDQGGTSFNYSTDGKTVTYSITVQIPGSHVGIALDEDVGHEGTHVGQDQALAASIAPNGSFNNGLNLTTYGAENPAYHVNAAIIQASGQPRSLDPAGNYVIRPGDSPGQVDNTINRYLADTTNPYHGVTPQNPGPPAIIQTQRNP